MRTALLVIIAVLILPPCVLHGADTVPIQSVTQQSPALVDITTLSGVTYTNCKVTRVEPNGVTVFYAKGIAKIAFTELPEALRTKYNYNPTNAALYTRTVNQKQAEARVRQQARLQEADAASSASQQREQKQVLQKKVGVLIAKARIALAEKKRSGQALTSDCRVLMGCTKDEVVATIGTPSFTGSNGAIWFYNNSFIDPESRSYATLNIDFKGDTVSDVGW